MPDTEGRRARPALPGHDPIPGSTVSTRPGLPTRAQTFPAPEGKAEEKRPLKTARDYCCGQIAHIPRTGETGRKRYRNDIADGNMLRAHVERYRPLHFSNVVWCERNPPHGLADCGAVSCGRDLLRKH